MSLRLASITAWGGFRPSLVKKYSGIPPPRTEGSTVALLRQPAFDWPTVVNPDVLLRAVWRHPPLWLEADSVHQPLPATLARRLRLFGVASARMVWSLLPTDARNALVLSERYADGRTTGLSLRAAAVRMRHGPATWEQHATNAAGWASAGDAPPANHDPLLWNPRDAAGSAAKALATRAAGPAPPGGNPVAPAWQITWNTTFAKARTHQAELVRDIFPPPGYTPGLHPDWQTATVRALAQQMDETGDFSAVPILADALQDAGCDDDAVLDRCRAESGVHCRGNWVVDLVLGRE
jgi:hypothetical protein